jgi:hypothetical protein
MSKTWKWILGIVLVLVIIGAMFAIGYMWQTHRGTGWNMPLDREKNGPMEHQWNQQIPGPEGRRMKGGREFAPFGGFFLLGGLVKLALFFGLLYGAYWLGRRNARVALDPKPAARIEAPAPVEVVEQPTSAPRKRTKKVE